jgi:GT2 family glycosyltransferase
MWFDLATDAVNRGRDAHDPADSRRWLERARRIVPNDDVIGLSLALACLNGGDFAAARGLLAPIAARWDLFEAWVGLAAAAVQARDWPAAVLALQPALSRHAIKPDACDLAALVAKEAGWPGWCATDASGRLQADGPADLFLDGVRIPSRWTANGVRVPAGRSLVVTRDGVALLGSPIDLQALNAVEGFVAGTGDGGLSGWAWHPNNPERAPVIELRFADGSQSRILAKLPLEVAEPGRPLMRARRFVVARVGIPPGPVEVLSGRQLWGSPIDPGLERRSAAGLEASFTPVWADVVGPTPSSGPLRRGADVVVPVYRGLRTVMACLDSVLPTLPDGSRLHVVDDGGVDAELGHALDSLAVTGSIVLHRLPTNRGFPSAANTGLRAAAGRDVVLLNSDTVVPPGWLQHLAETAYSAPEIGSVCPLSNDATILSYPKRNSPNPMRDPVALSALARRANGLATVHIPVAVGFCMYIRRDCLDAVGLLREDLWAQGYGEENDWCLRARHLGWRHVAAPGCFVAHEGGASFGPARRHLLARNGAQLERLHPGYGAMVAAWIDSDPLGPARRRMDAIRWREGRQQSAVVLVTHAAGGGVDRVVRERVRALHAASVRPIVIRPDGDAAVVGDGDTPNLRYRLPHEWDGLLRLLRTDRVALVELHHTLGHSPELLRLPERLGVPYEVFVHDYASFCARIALVPEHSYCGEPPIAGCEACVADHGSNLEEDIGPVALVARSTLLLAGARRVVSPAFDVATRIRRHFPAVLPAVTPWEEDNTVPVPPPTRRPIRHVCVIGGIGVEKGYEVLLGCVRDAAARSLPLRFTVAGYTADDERMLAAGPVFITGQYREDDGESLIREQDADIALIPSVWPETWCFTLGLAWRAGLRAAVFDLGAPAERVRRTGWGDVLPLGMPPAALNTWLLRPYA